MRSFVLAIAVLILLSSCTDDPEPIEPTPSPTPSAKATATAPSMPHDATNDTPDAAIAFVQHWINVFNFAVNTGAVDEFDALNGSACGGCKSYEEQIRKSNKGAAEVRNFKWIGGKSSLSDDRTLEASIRATDYETRDSTSDAWSKVRGSTFKLGFELKWADGRWTVNELFVPDSE